MKFVLSIAVYFFFNILQNANGCEHNEFPKSERTSTEHGVPVAGPILQKRTHDNFTDQSALHFDYEKNRLMFVDRKRAEINFYYPANGGIDTCHIAELDNEDLAFVIRIPGKDDSYILAANNTIYMINLNSCQKQQSSCSYELTQVTTLPTQQNEIIGHGTVDANGNLLFGSKSNDHTTTDRNAKIYRVELKNNNTKVVDDGYIITAGIVFDENHENLYVADANANVVYHLKYDAQTGQVTNKTSIFNMTDYKNEYAGKVSGLTVDTDGKIWISFVGARMIILFDPNTKQIEQVVDIPVTVTDSIIFGDDNKDTLYVGSSNYGYWVDKRQEPQAGALFSVIGLSGKGFKANPIAI